MKHELKLTLESSDMVALSRGQSIALTIGDQVVMLHAEMARPLHTTNGHVGRRPGSKNGRCGYCKRDLRVAKHAKNCRVLRSASVQLGLRRKKEAK
jgi:hypothetical protein